MKLSAIIPTFLASILFGSAGAAAQSIVSPQGKPEITHKALLKTSMGDILLGLHGKDAPKTVENFLGLAQSGYYDSTLFHRIVPDFVIQGGDPTTRDTTKVKSWGRGGKSIWGGKFEDELNPETPSYRLGYEEGVLAMANSGPNTNGSQFFICLENLDLAKNYTMFGKVLEGMDVVLKIAGTELLPNTSLPATAVMIISVREALPEEGKK